MTLTMPCQTATLLPRSQAHGPSLFASRHPPSREGLHRAWLLQQLMCLLVQLGQQPKQEVVAAGAARQLQDASPRQQQRNRWRKNCFGMPINQNYVFLHISPVALHVSCSINLRRSPRTDTHTHTHCPPWAPHQQSQLHQQQHKQAQQCHQYQDVRQCLMTLNR